MKNETSVDEFVVENECEYSSCLIRNAAIPYFEREMDVRFGSRMRIYILKYGHLSYKFADLLGINSFLGRESDMVKTTKRVHERFPETKGLIVLENLGEEDYRLVDSEDSVYKFIPEANIFEPMGMNMSRYILSRFQEVRAVTNG